MALSDTIKQAISDFNDIEAAIEEQGIDVPYGTDTKEYGRLIRSIAGNRPQNTYYANGSVYAVCFEWSDGNTNKENRLNRFVQLTDGGNKISFANSTADICGVTTETAGFVENYGVYSEYTSFVGILGIVTVIDNGTCTVGETCMSDDNGYAIPSSNNMGYRVMARVDANKIKVDVKPNDDMIQRIKTDVTTLVNDIDSIKQIMSGYQTKEDLRLTTTDKTVAGAINELNTIIGDVSTILDNINGEVV